MIRGIDGRDISRDLDRYITGNYGEDQFKRGRMAGHTPYISMQHESVGAVACPYCDSPKGVPCVSTGKKALIPGVRQGTHLRRVQAFERAKVEAYTGAKPVTP